MRFSTKILEYFLACFLFRNKNLIDLSRIYHFTHESVIIRILLLIVIRLLLFTFKCKMLHKLHSAHTLSVYSVIFACTIFTMLITIYSVWMLNFATCQPEYNERRSIFFHNFTVAPCSLIHISLLLVSLQLLLSFCWVYVYFSPIFLLVFSFTLHRLWLRHLW